MGVSKISGPSVIPPVMETKRSSGMIVLLPVRVFQAEAKHFSTMNYVFVRFVTFPWKGKVLIFRSIVDPILWKRSKSVRLLQSLRKFRELLLRTFDVWILLCAAGFFETFLPIISSPRAFSIVALISENMCACVIFHSELQFRLISSFTKRETLV